jgi:capsular polysaccharide biosynthesis protein
VTERTGAEEFIEEEISLKELFAVICKRVKMILAITIIAVIASAVFTFAVLKPEYESNTTLMVGKPVHKISVDQTDQISYQEIQTNRLLVSTYGEIAKSRSVLDSVIKTLKLDIDTACLRGKINVSLVKDTEIIRISVTDNDPEKAATIANELAQAFAKQVVKIMNVENIQVIDEAIQPQSPVKPRPVLNISVAFVLGLIVGIFAAFIMEFFDTSIKSPEDVAKYLDLPVIGTIPYVQKEG